ncbi:MAG: metalloregulator ArsR/SmtB family transcription factor [Cellvibrionales bacterium]|nr:metalloregulator ArsR/SmtB family transcription factor [Cellvibrionales bacterium]
MNHSAISQLADNANQAASLLKAISNPHRLLILCLLLEKPLSVNDINAFVSLSQSALSQHLAALRKADLVSTERSAQTIYYQVKGDAPKAIIHTLKTIYCPDL